MKPNQLKQEEWIGEFDRWYFELNGKITSQGEAMEYEALRSLIEGILTTHDNELIKILGKRLIQRSGTDYVGETDWDSARVFNSAISEAIQIIKNGRKA